MATRRRFAAVGLLCTFLCACSGFKDYRGAGDANLTIRSEIAGSFWRKAAAHVHLFRVTGQCDAAYLGTLELDRSELQTAVPAQQRIYLQFVFETAPRLGQGGGSSVSYPVVFTPRPDAAYEADARYVDAMYSVTFRENGRERDPALGACPPDLQP